MFSLQVQGAPRFQPVDGLSARISFALFLHGVGRAETLLQLTEFELSAVVGLGPLKMEQVRAWFAAQGAVLYADHLERALGERKPFDLDRQLVYSVKISKSLNDHFLTLGIVRFRDLLAPNKLTALGCKKIKPKVKQELDSLLERFYKVVRQNQADEVVWCGDYLVSR